LIPNNENQKQNPGMNSMLIQTVFTVLRDKTNMDDLMEEEKR
jgi:hypothetical protein